MGRRRETRAATNAIPTLTSEAAISSKKKRKRKDKEAVDVSEHTVAVDDASLRDPETQGKSKKKKKKRHADAQDDVEKPDVKKQKVVIEDARSESPESSKKEKKKKKKDKRKERRVDQTSDPQIDPALTAQEAQPSQEAFAPTAKSAVDGPAVAEHVQATDVVQQTTHASGSQNMLPGLNGAPISFSGEDLARVIQGLDVAKIADALHALGVAGSSTFPLPGQPITNRGPEGQLNHHPAQEAQYSNHVRPISSSGHRQNQPGGNVTAPSSSRKPVPMPITVSLSQLEDHARLLASKWLSATKLNELARTTGLHYKKGKFSAAEEALVKDAIENYRIRNHLTDEQLRRVIYAGGVKDRNNAFWYEITSHVPMRPIVAVYHHVRRSYHPLKQQGKWTPAEDEALRQAVLECGQLWEKVSERVGRMGGDCRDRWRNYVKHHDGRVLGHWSKEEEEKLTQIVTELTTAQGRDPDLDVFWTQVAARMGTRGRQQCRIKWTDCLSKTVKNAGEKPRWSQQDAYILVHKIDSLNVHDDSEIDWKLLNDENWNLWSGHSLQRRWLTLKRSVKGHEEMTHQEIMDILRVKKAQLPPVPAPIKRRVTSAPIVPAEAQAGDTAIEDTYAFNGPGGFGVLPGTPFTTDANPMQPQFGPFVPTDAPIEPAQTVISDNTGASASDDGQLIGDSSSSNGASDASDRL